MSFMVGGFRSTVSESAGWHSHIPEPEDGDDACSRCGGTGNDPSACNCGGGTPQGIHEGCCGMCEDCHGTGLAAGKEGE